MQYVNDDMDELFRKAAKDYPLNTGGADWEKLQKALEEPPAGSERRSGRDNRRHLLWLLLLLPLPWICTRYDGDGNKDTANAPALQKRVNRTVPAGSERVVQEVEYDVPVQERPSKPTVSSSPGLLSAASIQERAAGLKGHRSNNALTGKDWDRMRSSESATDAIKSQEYEYRQEEAEDVERSAEQESVASTEKKEVTPASAQDTTDSIATKPATTKKVPVQKSKRFYAGIIGGADITSIEMQKVKKIGYDVGVVAGYAFSDKWSVEAGVLSSEKAYYSSGEHLYKAYLLPGTKLLEAEGDCRMWEVPLVVRYRFQPGKKSGWVASVGSSSYFMKEESYDYTYYYTTTGQEVKRSRSYYNDSRHLFAAAQLSGGYNRRVGKSMEVRIEPYLKLPLRKVGYYDLPLTSFGVHAGITKKLF
jgi:hypothetical protein